MGTKMAPEIGAIKNLPAEKSMGRDCGAKRQEPSSIYSCSIGHIWEHEFCHLGCWAVK